MNLALTLTKERIREYLSDIVLARRAMAVSLSAALPLLRKSPRRFDYSLRLYSKALSGDVDAQLARIIYSCHREEVLGSPTGLWACYDAAVQQAVQQFSRGPDPRPERLIGSRILVVKGARSGERGVIVVDYSYVFALLAGLFDLDAIAQRYFLVLEPSWRGVATPEILLYSRLPVPVFVQTVEPRDHAFLGGGDWSLRAVPIGANFWVDPRQAPKATVTRDIDVVMVASWSSVKRHWRVFDAVARLRRRGHRLTMALVGYKYDKTMSDVRREVAHFGISDQVSLYEGLQQPEVRALLARSKVHVLWSRQECSNRAVIEAMLSDVPVLVREGLTYGHPYAYINTQTGRFVAEGELGEAILETIANFSHYTPRQWVLNHMTPDHATLVLEGAIRREAAALGEPWTEGLAVKTASLHTQSYWNPADRERFSADYQFLESLIRPI